MQRYEEGKDRNQVQIVNLEDLISEDNPVRVIDAFVNNIDMAKLGFQYAETKDTGRKPMNPADMSKLYIYGYYNGVRVSRKLERECEKNIEVMWLINNLKPHNKTISEFRRNNKEALKNLFKEFSILCDTLGLIGKEMAAIDGSKFRASNSRKRNYTKNKVKKMIKYFEESANKYLELLEKNDNDDTEQKIDFTEESLTAKIEAANKRIEELKEMYEDIEKNGEISITDKDAKHMGVSNNGTDIAHNVQIAVDSKNHLVVAVDVVSNPDDTGQLFNMAKQTAEELGIELKNKEENQSEEEYGEYLLTVLADKGYYEYENLRNCLDSGVKPIVAKEKSSNKTGNEKYIRDNFIYDKEKDIYICPEGKILNNISKPTSQNQLYKNKEACKECPFKDQCTTSSDDERIIKRNEQHDIYDIVNKIMDENKHIYKERQEIVEHVFGTVKRSLGYTYFLTRGNESVKAESYMHFLAYNLKRVINIIGVKALVEAINSININLFWLFYRLIHKRAYDNFKIVI
jgi:transposase